MNVTVVNNENIPTPAERLQNKITGIVQKNISKAEMRRFMAMEELEDRNLSAAMLNILYKSFGFSIEQLKDFYFKSAKAFDNSTEYTVKLEPIPEMLELKKMGLDIEALQSDYLIGNI